MIEARKHAKRIELDLEVKFRKSYGRNFKNAQVRNISLSGAFLEGAEYGQLQERDKLNLTFHIGGRSREISAKIVWVGKSGCGLEFSHGNHQDEQLIDDLMYFVEEKKDDKKEILDCIFSKVA